MPLLDIRFFALPPVRRLEAAGLKTEVQKGAQESVEQPPSTTEGGGDDA